MKNRIKKAFLVSSAILMMCSSISFADINVSRISGSDRYETAIKVNQKYIQKADGNLAIIASGNDFRTALYGSYMASALKVPFYVLPKNQAISKSVLNEFDRLNVKRAYIIGDSKKLSTKVDNTLLKSGISSIRFDYSKPVKDLEGIDSQVDMSLFETFHKNENKGDIGRVIFINDSKFPDLLSVIPFASSLIKEQSTALLNLNIQNWDNPEYDNIYISNRFTIGGYDTIPEKFRVREPFDGSVYEDKLIIDDSSDYPEYHSYGRIYGSDRYKTAVEIAKAYKPVLNKDISTAVIVNGKDYPDALSSGLVATYNNGAILLTQPNELNKDTAEYIKTNTNIKNIIIVGGENSVSKNVENELKLLK